VCTYLEVTGKLQGRSRSCVCQEEGGNGKEQSLWGKEQNMEKLRWLLSLGKKSQTPPEM
jgi:hypothetical protein